MSTESLSSKPEPFHMCTQDEMQHGQPKLFVDTKTGVWRPLGRNEQQEISTSTTLKAVSERMRSIVENQNSAHQLGYACEIVQHINNITLLQGKVITSVRSKWDWIPIIGKALGDKAEKSVKSKFAPLLAQIGSYIDTNIKALDLEKWMIRPWPSGLTNAQIQQVIQKYTQNPSREQRSKTKKTLP